MYQRASLRIKSSIILLLCLALLPRSAAAEGAKTSEGLNTDVSLRLREEMLDWYAPQPSGVIASVPEENDNYFHAKLQAGVRYETQQLTAGAQLQYFGLTGLERGTLGPGGTYFATNGESSTGDVSLRQAYVTLNPSVALPIGITVGRVFYASGGEVKSADSDLQLLKQRRIFNRVLGTFDFTGGRSFDGVSLRAPAEDYTVNASYFRPTQGGFATDATAQIDEIEFTTLSFTAPLPISHSNEFQLFHYYFEDTRDEGIVKADNRGASAAADALGIRIHNVGFSTVHLVKTDSSVLDGLFWGILQAGNWGSDDHRAGAFAVEAGARLLRAPMQPRLGAGYSWGSGDSAAEDGDHTTFYQMLPTARQYALVPFYNAMNNEDLFAQLNVRPIEKVELSAGVHLLRLQNTNDLLYVGGGANKSRDQFGFSGTALSGSADIGTLLEVEASVQIFPWWLVGAFFGHLECGEAFAAFGDRSLDYGFIESTLKLSWQPS